MLLGNKVAGIILASHTQNLEEFADVDAPVITIDRTVSPRIPSACADNYYGGCIAAEHLIARGCRRLLYVSGSAHLDMDANKRYLGFQDACRRLDVLGPAPWTRPSGSSCAWTIRKRWRPSSATTLMWTAFSAPTT